MIKDAPLIVLFGTFSNSVICLSIILILLNKVIFYKNKKFIYSIFILTFYAFISYIITDNFLRTIGLFIVTNFCVYYILNFSKRKLLSIIITTFFVWVIMALLDILSNIFIIGVFNIDMEAYRDNILLVLSINFIVLFFLCMFFYNESVRKFIRKISYIDINYDNFYLLIIIIFAVITTSIVFTFCVFKFPYVLISITVFIMVVIYTIITFMSIKFVNQKNRIQSEYDILLSNLSEYENLLDRQRIINHENKNQLLAIKGMIDDNKKADSYINTLLEEQYSENDMLIAKTNKIPSGGLKGLIYYKMITMKDKKIDVSLEVGNLQRVTYLEMNPKINQDLCKIVGVLLDNAIQEVENLNEKNINIVIENQNKDLIIKISNNYGEVELHRIGENGYTTKGKGHGYGLKLVKQIVTNNDDFEQYTEISGKVFSQIVKLHAK